MSKHLDSCVNHESDRFAEKLYKGKNESMKDISHKEEIENVTERRRNGEKGQE